MPRSSTASAWPSPQALAFLREIVEHLARLTYLSLNNNGIGDERALALAESPYLSGLTDLALWNNGITDAGLRALLDSPHLAGLSSLALGLNSIRGNEVRKAYRARFGGVI
jgi:hypothetical protein